MEPVTGSILSLKGIMAIIGVFLASFGGYALMTEDTQVGNTNFLLQADNSGSGFRDEVLIRADNVENTINNMLSDDVSASKADSYIIYEKTFSKDQTALSSDDMQVNKAYYNYLKAASDVVDAYSYDALDIQDKIDIMNQKRNLI
jgi:hypothetical protein